MLFCSVAARYGVITTGRTWYMCKVDDGALLISPPIAWDSQDPLLLAAVAYIMSKAWEDQDETISVFPTGQGKVTPCSVSLKCTCQTSRRLPSFLPAFGCINIYLRLMPPLAKGSLCRPGCGQPLPATLPAPCWLLPKPPVQVQDQS